MINPVCLTEYKKLIDRNTTKQLQIQRIIAGNGREKCIPEMGRSWVLIAGKRENSRRRKTADVMFFFGCNRKRWCKADQGKVDGCWTRREEEATGEPHRNAGTEGCKDRRERSLSTSENREIDPISAVRE